MSSPPPSRLATAQALAEGRRRPNIHPSLLRVQQRLKKNAANPRVQFGPGLTEARQAMKLQKIFTKLMLLPRGDLRSAFHGVSFASATDESRRLEHVLNEFARTGTACFVDLEELFPGLEEAPAGPLNPDERPDFGTTAISLAAAKGGDFEREGIHHVGSVDQDSVRVLLISSAGCGKTTLMTQYCPMQWARGALWEEKFDLVIAKEFRYEETRRVNSFGDLLGGWERVGVASTEDKQCVLDFVMNSPHRVCLTLDGLDETKLRNCSEYLQKVICGEELCGIHLVLTSRATNDVFRLSESHPFDRRIELVGFLPSDVPEYVKRVLERDLAERLLAEIKKNSFLAGVMCTPYFAASICDLFKWRNQVPRCLSDVVELMILRIAERRTGQSHENWESVGEDVKKQIMDLGEFAFRMLVKQQLVFSDEILSALSLSEESVGLGLLVACERDAETVRRQWRFAHLSLQESLAAMFVGHGSDMYPRKVVRLVEVLGPLSSHLETFWQLLSARLSPECMDCLVNALLLCEHEPNTSGEVESLLFDRENFPQALVDAMESQLSQDQLDRLAIKLLDGLVSGSGSLAVENALRYGRQTSNVEFLKTLLVMWKKHRREANVGELLERIGELGDAEIAVACATAIGLRPATFIQDNDHLPMKDLTGSFHTRAQQRLVFRCYAEYVQHVAGDGKVTSILLPSMGAYLSKNPMYIDSTTDAKTVFAMVQVLQIHQSYISMLDIEFDRGVSEHHYELLSLLPSCDSVNKLHVQSPDFDLTEGRNDWLFCLIRRSASSLTQLVVSSLGRDDSVAFPFWSEVVHCVNLKTLEVGLPRLVPLVPAGIASMSDLETLSLKVSLFSVDHAAELLSAMASLSLISVSLQGLKSPCLRLLAAAVNSWPHLQTLHLDDLLAVGTTPGGCASFLTAVRSLPNLRELGIELSRDSCLEEVEVETVRPLLVQRFYPSCLKLHMSRWPFVVCQKE